jgi:hypothetical protein
MTRHKKPRPSRRQLIGQRVLGLVPTYHLDGGGIISVTAARHFVRKKGIDCPAVIKVTRTQWKTDMFFLGDNGMFGLTYAEYNWMLFPSLKEIYKTLDEKEFSEEYRPDFWAMNQQFYRPEFAFV